MLVVTGIRLESNPRHRVSLDGFRFLNNSWARSLHFCWLDYNPNLHYLCLKWKSRLVKSDKYFILKGTSNSQLSIICLEVEFSANRTEGSWYLFVEIIDISLKLAFSLSCGKVEGESLWILNFLSFLSIEPGFIMLIHEVSIPSLIPQDTKVLNQLKRVDLWDDWSSCFRSDVGIVIFEHMRSPLLLEFQVIEIGLRRCFIFDVLWHEEARSSKINSSKSFSSSGFQNPMVWVETEWLHFYVYLATCSKKTLLLRCLSMWRSPSSGVWVKDDLQVPVAGRYWGCTSFIVGRTIWRWERLIDRRGWFLGIDDGLLFVKHLTSEVLIGVRIEPLSRRTDCFSSGHSVNHFLVQDLL